MRRCEEPVAYPLGYAAEGEKLMYIGIGGLILLIILLVIIF